MGSISQAVQMGFDALNGYNSYKVQKATLQGQKIVGQATNAANDLLNEVNANAANVMRGENNTLMAAKAALANLQRSGKNQDMLQAAGEKTDAASRTLTRLAEQKTASSLEARIAAAEQQGSITAAAAASGTGGSAARMVKQALAAASARKEFSADAQYASNDFELRMQRAGLMSGVVAQLDEGQTFAPIDLTHNTAQKTIAPMWAADYQGSAWSAILGSLSSKSTAAIGDSIQSIYKYATSQSSNNTDLKSTNYWAGNDVKEPTYGAGGTDTGYGAGTQTA